VLPLFRRFPALERLPRAALGEYPTPVERVTGIEAAGELWLKRDDLDAPAFGGNKVRALEFLLGGVRPGDEVLTIGGEGSTHVLTTAALAARLGARTRAIRWPHEMNPTSRQVAARASLLCASLTTVPTPIHAVVRSLIERRSRVRWVPFGGTSPLGMLGHVNAGLELAEQVACGELPAPTRVVVPLGSGGTAAGLALGLAIAGLDATIAAVRVAPRIVTGRRRVLRLARTTSAFIERLTGERPPPVSRARVQVVHDAYGGAYGRVLPAAVEAAALLRRAVGARLDDTYSAKAFTAALRMAQHGRGSTLFWITFDGRWMESHERSNEAQRRRD
jgi:1-aminocyclopropane-1-carboxylate deaminase/D-cysteine desulfhydrase-like pyridoxal-dependent ACC family enzyme